MSNNVESAQNGGIGFFGALFITFLVLKLTGVVSWSWWWVTAPLWGPSAIGLIVLVVILIGWLFFKDK